jgi:hypothetical protein
MSKYPSIRKERALRKVKDDAVKVVEPAAESDVRFSFRYSYTEISAVGSKAHLKSRRARYEDGKLSTEAFDGEFDRTIYERGINDLQRFFLGQTAAVLRGLTSFLLPPTKKARDRE